MLTNSVPSGHTRWAYAKAFDDFLALAVRTGQPVILTSRKSTKLNGWVAALSRTVEHANASSRTTRVWLGA